MVKVMLDIKKAVQLKAALSFSLMFIGFLLNNSIYAGVCASNSSDPDGDGFGFENNQVCIVVKSCTDRTSDADGDGWGWENNQSCVATTTTQDPTTRAPDSATNQCVDEDGDGWGWDGVKSCRTDVAANTITATVAGVCVDTGSLGDGWGWDGIKSCRTTQSSTISSTISARCIDSMPVGDGWGWDGTRSCRITPTGSTSGSLSHITDVVLITGQSNTLGANTSVTPGIDDSSESVYAWTDSGWQVADLHQVWDLGWHPRTTPDGKNPHNNFALHFGKHVTANSDRVVAFILVSAPGKPISTWDIDKPLFNKIRAQVNTALSALPHIDKLSGILWHQGENDWYGGKYYQTKFLELINNFRQEPWLDWHAPFISGETSNAPVNKNLNSLNRDGDIRTACVSSAELGLQSDSVHFDAAGLRELGKRYAAKYLDIMAGDTSSM